MNKILDERTKLAATFLNGIAIAMVAAGGVAPLVAFAHDRPGAAGASCAVRRHEVFRAGGQIMNSVTHA